MDSEKACSLCEKIIQDMSNVVYCFTCDALYCEDCREKKLKKKDNQWLCPKCNEWKDLESSLLFKQK
ncbi:MAG: hypothetical protein ACTSVI_10095 [Promethearchaeota archaeon]